MKQHVLTHKRHRLDPAEGAEWLAEHSPIGKGTVPVRLIGWTDGKGDWRRFEATYPNGARLEVMLDALFSVTEIIERDPPEVMADG